MKTRRKYDSSNRKSRTDFTVATLTAIAEDLKNGVIPLKRVTISDPESYGLRAVIRDTGLISFHVQYSIDDSRPYLMIGHHPDRTIKEARELAETIRILAEKGIDPQLGLHDRLVRELLEKGPKWKP